MKKSIFLFFAAILCSVSAWAHDLAANQYVYFEKPSDWTQVALLLGHDGYSIGYNMTKISNTNLYYWKTASWGGYNAYAFIDAKDWGGQDWGDCKPDKRKKYASHYSSTFTTAIAKYHLFNTTKSVSSHASSYATAVNRTQTIKVQLKDGSNWVDATVVPADLKASTYALTSATAAGAKSASLAKESTNVSATVDAAYSAKVTLSCTNVLDGYVFDGWYDANGNKITSYTVSDAHTVYARFIQSAEETNEVTVTYMCGATSVATTVAEFVGVESEKSFTAPTVTGYNFTGWTIGAGITLKAGTASDATITVVTKSASSDYTLIANYEEVIETIYFINTGKWSVVNLHRWGGTAAETAWPGEAMTSTGEKIGEYDVYSFTAQQGAFKNVIFTNKNTGSDQTGDLEWTAGKYYINNYNGNSGWYTKAEAEELLVVPAVYETVYFVNNKNWTKVQIHAWKGSVNNGWPGTQLTATGEKVEGFDVYSFEAAQGSYTNLLFNNKVGDTGEQSSNYVWTADKYYYMGATDDYAGGTKEEVAALVAPDPLATDVFLAGEMNDWNATANEFKKAAAEATTASVTISLTAETYMFKIVAGDWLGNKGTMKRDNCAGWTFEKLDGGEETNCKIVADIAGDYTFTWDLTSKKLTVTYPELPTYNVTATVNPAETGSVEGAKTYKHGEQATLIATPAAGYEFVNWTVAGEEVSTEATYSFTVTADVALVANFAKKVYTVTVTAENGTIEGLADDGKYEHGAEATLTANPESGYKFVNWTSGETVVSTENPYKFTVTADVV
ncbi:MAG: starch-binding protein, partial [Paludibacteraceae bacterium]|nr:starch-binding protein [Paludibacteraceae bacterium]